MELNDCFGTKEYTKTNYICKRCRHYVECGNVLDKKSKKRIKKTGWKNNEVGKV